ncbi:MAG TPA: KilA-N domain-containing protein, partial [Campylobacterales bacterium]|nr:KilA-N domain-containing protein [Campylobacterales bacterium]
GGTYAHKDIALEFATWLSPKFKLYLIKEFQRLKENEADSKFKFQRIISKRNYKIQTQSIKDHLIPKLNPNENKTWVYASEADLLNLVLWGKTAKQWREENPDKPSDTNIRDYATVDELIVLSNIEVLNSELIKNNVPKKERIQILQESVISQFKALSTLKPITFEEIAGIEK